MTKEELEDFVEMMLEDESLEDLLERFNLTPTEAFLFLYKGGMVDTQLFNEMARVA